MADDIFWKTKLAARIHDPAEKALVLLRDPAGHEGGTSKALKRLLGLDQIGDHIDPDNDEALVKTVFKNGLPAEIYRHVQHADWWAAAADRPQFPLDEITVQTSNGEQRTLAVAGWAQVSWSSDTVLVHPLTGEQYRLPGGLTETDIADIKKRSFGHFSGLLEKLGAKEGGTQDFRKTLLTFWRFGPELEEEIDHGKLGELWKLLPADTRIPDHSIWDHLDLTSAFAGAFAADREGGAALLTVSIGPVQSFIATARKMDDLWAGSHLLSRLAWEAMRPVCETLGPDAILFPRLRGIPQVDLWLRDNMGLPHALFQNCDWMKSSTDANPLFAAALPNRFVAVVPANQARSIAETVQANVREWLKELGKDVVRRLLEVAGLDVTATTTPYDQMQSQLEGFPEVHWAAVPFSLIRPGNTQKQTELDCTNLSGAMAPFFETGEDGHYGFLGSPAWQVLQKEIDWGEGTKFFAPNPGVLYPAVYDLAERVLAAAKASRPFDNTRQNGWRCSLTGETEWLTADLAQLSVPPGARRDTLWTRVADKKLAWAKKGEQKGEQKGEHLGGLPAIKRLWPTIFAEEVEDALAAGNSREKKSVGRFVVSTHTMALAAQLEKWLDAAVDAAGLADIAKVAPVALPRRLAKNRHNPEALNLARRIPGFLEEAAGDESDTAYESARQRVQRILGNASGEEVKLETYYALLMMDGDNMGAILAGDKAETSIAYKESFHPKVRKGFDERAAAHPLIKQYGDQKRPVSPNRHLAISGALNDFSQTVVRHVVEEEHLGRVIYAGGDDVLAMLPVADLLSTMQRLRHAYSGIDPNHVNGEFGGLTLNNGFAALKCGGQLQLMRMMGQHATASCGAVIAHHQAPLGAVMRELRAAEKRAKNEGGRNAFSITVIKRAGGALHLTENWGEPVALLKELIVFLSREATSRRAAYNCLEWLRDLPDPKQAPDMLESLLAYQLERQSGDRKSANDIARRLAALAVKQTKEGLVWLENFLGVAEFLARETRAGDQA